MTAFYKSHLKDVKSQQTISSGSSQIAMFNVGKDKVDMVIQVIRDPKKKENVIQVMKQGQ